MKKLLVSTILLLGFILVAQAQIGLKAGVNLASLNQEGIDESFESIEDGTVVGLQAGLVFRIPIAAGFHIQPEVMFIQKGGQQDYEVPALDRQTNVKTFYDYFEVPIMAQYYFGSDATGFFVEGGPFLGLAMQGKNEVKTTLAGINFENTEKFDFDDEDRQKRLDYGFALGLGYAINNNIAINVRYNLGINNLRDDDANNNNDNEPKVNTRGLAFSLGYYF